MFFSSGAVSAARDMSIEVDLEAKRIIEQEGLPLYSAMEKARKIVQERRRAATAEKEDDEFFDSFGKLIDEQKAAKNGEEKVSNPI